MSNKSNKPVNQDILNSLIGPDKPIKSLTVIDPRNSHLSDQEKSKIKDVSVPGQGSSQANKPPGQSPKDGGSQSQHGGTGQAAVNRESQGLIYPDDNGYRYEPVEDPYVQNPINLKWELTAQTREKHEKFFEDNANNVATYMNRISMPLPVVVEQSKIVKPYTDSFRTQNETKLLLSHLKNHKDYATHRRDIDIGFRKNTQSFINQKMYQNPFKKAKTRYEMTNYVSSIFEQCCRQTISLPWFFGEPSNGEETIEARSNWGRAAIKICLDILENINPRAFSDDAMDISSDLISMDTISQLSVRSQSPELVEIKNPNPIPKNKDPRLPKDVNLFDVNVSLNVELEKLKKANDELLVFKMKYDKDIEDIRKAHKAEMEASDVAMGKLKAENSRLMVRFNDYKEAAAKKIDQIFDDMKDGYKSMRDFFNKEDRNDKLASEKLPLESMADDQVVKKAKSGDNGAKPIEKPVSNQTKPQKKDR